jgi:cellulose biosynthesis protein BcsQ
VKINLITALSSHQVEDQVIEVLLKHDFQLQKRLLSLSDFDSKLISSISALRILIISDKDFGLNWREIRGESDENLSILILDVDKRFSSDEILQQANQALRGSKEILPTRDSIRRDSWVLFTGSDGSPGISTLALNTAQEYSKLAQMLLIDADLSQQSLSQMVGERVSYQRSALNNALSLQSIASFDEIESREDESVFIDVGSAPVMSQAVSDRRTEGKFFMQALNSCSHLIYIIHQDSRALYQLEQFEEFLKMFSSKLNVIYLLNKESSSSSRPLFRKSFRSKIDGKPHFFMPYEYGNLERARNRYATLSEVNSRSSLSRALRELAIYLHKII